MQPKPYKMMLPDHLRIFGDTILDEVGEVFGQDGNRKNMYIHTYQVMVLPPLWIIVTCWCGSHFGLNLGYILEPFWHHRGVAFRFHLGQNQFLNQRFKFWIHFGFIFGAPKLSKKRSKNKSQNRSKKRSPKLFEKHHFF